MMSGYTVDKLPEEALPDVTELSGDLQMLAEVVGVRLALQIAELFDGTPARLYGHRRWLVKWRDKQMRGEYDGGGISVVDLARKYGVSERHAYNILGQEPVEERQLKLF
jgi:Mor family transcriptional regulator